MAGALNSMMRRRFSDGGEAADPPPSANPQYQELLNETLEGDAAPAPGTQAPRPALAPQDADPGAADKMARIRNAMAVLQAGSSPGVSSSGSGINLPLLAAAAAIGAPTKTGGFSEALSNAMGAGAGALQQQRQAEATNALRQATLDQNSLYRQGVLANQGVRADAYAQNMDSLAWARERMADLKSQGLDDTAAWRQLSTDARIRGIDTRALVAMLGQQQRSDDVRYGVDARAGSAADRNAIAAAALSLKTAKANAPRGTTQADITKAAIEDLMTREDPNTGENYTYADAARHMKLADIQQQRADTGTAGVEVNRQRGDAQRAQWAVSNAAAAERNRLASLGINARMIDAAINAASKDFRVLSGKSPPGPVIDQWLAEQKRAMANPPAATGAPAPQAAAPAAAPAAQPVTAAPRAATGAEKADAQAWLKRYGDTPANRELAKQQFIKNSVTPPPDL